MLARQITPNAFLKHERELRGWSQKRVAELVGAPDAKTIARWENGRTLPSPHYREQLCKVFGKSAEELGLLEAASCWEDALYNFTRPRKHAALAGGARSPSTRLSASHACSSCWLD